tara:strand:- start:2815 stop:3465 length:651 start_codon:yes stop_codon:yes gene_type:complete
MTNITTLQQSLINAKKVMTKVDGGDFTTSGMELPNVNASRNINASSVQQHLPNVQESLPSRLSIPSTLSTPPNITPKANMNEEKIKNSNLPDAIKEAMINNPIPDIPFNGGAGLSKEFLSGVKTQMDKQGISTSIPSTSIPSTPQSITPTSTKTKKLSSKNLKSIIKESVKELLEEVVNTKINENMGVRTDMGENFQFRVGDKVFYGKITSSKTIK